MVYLIQQGHCPPALALKLLHSLTEKLRLNEHDHKYPWPKVMLYTTGIISVAQIADCNFIYAYSTFQCVKIRKYTSIHSVAAAA